jgi:hypothetical protein
MGARGRHSPLANITFESDSRLKLIESVCFRGCSFTSICIPQSVEVLGNGCFAGFSGDDSQLETVAFEPDSHLKRIERTCFCRCGSGSICIPRSVEILGEYCFADSGFETIIFESGSQLKETGQGCFCESSLKSISFTPKLDTRANHHFWTIGGSLIDLCPPVVHNSSGTFRLWCFLLFFGLEVVFQSIAKVDCFSLSFVNGLLLFVTYLFMGMVSLRFCFWRSDYKRNPSRLDLCMTFIRDGWRWCFCVTLGYARSVWWASVNEWFCWSLLGFRFWLIGILVITGRRRLQGLWMHLPFAVSCMLIHLWVNYDVVRTMMWHDPPPTVSEIPISGS